MVSLTVDLLPLSLVQWLTALQKDMGVMRVALSKLIIAHTMYKPLLAPQRNHICSDLTSKQPCLDYTNQISVKIGDVTEDVGVISNSTSCQVKSHLVISKSCERYVRICLYVFKQFIGQGNSLIFSPGQNSGSHLEI